MSARERTISVLEKKLSKRKSKSESTLSEAQLKTVDRVLDRVDKAFEGEPSYELLIGSNPVQPQTLRQPNLDFSLAMAESHRMPQSLASFETPLLVPQLNEFATATKGSEVHRIDATDEGEVNHYRTEGYSDGQGLSIIRITSTEDSNEAQRGVQKTWEYLRREVGGRTLYTLTITTRRIKEITEEDFMPEGEHQEQYGIEVNGANRTIYVGQGKNRAAGIIAYSGEFGDEFLTDKPRRGHVEAAKFFLEARTGINLHPLRRGR